MFVVWQRWIAAICVEFCVGEHARWLTSFSSVLNTTWSIFEFHVMTNDVFVSITMIFSADSNLDSKWSISICCGHFWLFAAKWFLRLNSFPLSHRTVHTVLCEIQNKRLGGLGCVRCALKSRIIQHREWQRKACGFKVKRNAGKWIWNPFINVSHCRIRNIV